MRFKIISLDVWGNAEDGYEINAAYYTGRALDVADGADDAAFARALVEAGELNDKALPPGAIKIDGEDDYTLFVEDAENGYPLVQLERVKDHA